LQSSLNTWAAKIKTFLVPLEPIQLNVYVFLKTRRAAVKILKCMIFNLKTDFNIMNIVDKCAQILLIKIEKCFSIVKKSGLFHFWLKSEAPGF
jgi:hypothetical protein